MRLSRAVLGALVALALVAVPAAPAQAQVEDTIYESLSIPTVDGDRIHVEVARPKGVPKAPVILTYSPYNSLSEGTSPNLAYDDLGLRYLPKGYARAVADVLGTRNSSGCWDYGGRKEQQSGVDLVNALAAQPWSNGKVAMIGGSYDGTTANMVGARGGGAPGLAAIVPELAISRWYGYAYAGGIRYLGNSQRPTDEGFDTPFAFDFGIARTPPTQRTPQTIDAMRDRMNPCDSVEHTIEAYDTSPDYDGFWDERDYRKDAASFRASTLVVHGWQDYNVKQSEGVDLYEAVALPTTASADAPFKRLYLFQGAHQTPSGRPHFDALLDEFLDTTLRGAAPGPELAAPVLTQGRTSAGDAEFRAEQAWPPAAGATQRLALGRALTGGTLGGPGGGPAASFTDTGTTAEEVALRAPDAEHSWLTYQTVPLAAGVRIAGTPRLELTIVTDQDHGHLTPVLADIAPDGTATAISRGFLNLRYRNGLRDDEAVPPGVPVSATVTFSPQDHTVAAGHRIGLILAGSNVVWAVPDAPAGTTTTVVSGTLVLPVAP